MFVYYHVTVPIGSEPLSLCHSSACKRFGPCRILGSPTPHAGTHAPLCLSFVSGEEDTRAPSLLALSADQKGSSYFSERELFHRPLHHASDALRPPLFFSFYRHFECDSAISETEASASLAPLCIYLRARHTTLLCLMPCRWRSISKSALAPCWASRAC